MRGVLHKSMNHASATKKFPGHSAATPLKIPRHGWQQIAKRVWQQLGQDNVQIVSAGVAFYFFLSLFPAIAAFLALYGLITSPEKAAEQVSQLQPLVPQDAYRLIAGFAEDLAKSAGQSLGWGLALSIFLSMFSANKATTALFTGLNIAYNREESRPFVRRTLLTLGVTLAAIVSGSLLLAAVAVIPVIRQALPLPEGTDMILNLLRWPLIVVIGFGVVSVLYKVAPNRKSPRWRWVTPGSIVAVLLWLLGSAGFGWYIESFGDMSKTYGSLAAIVVLMLWFFITAYAILLGAEINSEIEYQTDGDSTSGPEEPSESRNPPPRGSVRQRQVR